MSQDTVTLKSSTGEKQFFEISFINTLDKNIINNSLITQSIEYKVDDEDWKIFNSYYNSYINRTILYGYQVELRNYTFEPDSYNYGSELINTYSTYTIINNDNEYDSYGNVWMPGITNIQIDEIDDMTAQELLAEIESLRAELQELKIIMNREDGNWHGGTSLNNFIESKHYLTYHQSLNSYATKSYVASYVSNRVQETKNWVSNQNYLTEHQSLNDYTTKSYVNEKIVSTKLWVESKNYLTDHQILDNDSIMNDDGDELYVNKHNIIDNYTLTVNPDPENSINKRGNIAVVTTNLEHATSSSYGISKGDENTINVNNGIFTVNTENLDRVDDETNTNGIVQHSSEMFRTIAAKNGKLSVLTYNLDKATSTQYGIIKTDDISVQTDEFGILSIKSSYLNDFATKSYVISYVNNYVPKSYINSYINVDHYSISIVDGQLSVNRYSDINKVLNNYDSTINSIREDINTLYNHTHSLETIASQERIEFLNPIGDTETILPQPVFDKETWTVDNYSTRKTILFSVRTNCKFNINIEYKVGTNDYNQVTLLNVTYGDDASIPANQLANTQFDATGNTVKNLYFTFAVKNYDKDDDILSIDTYVKISAASINDTSIKQTSFHIFKCWNNIAFTEDEPEEPTIEPKYITQEELSANSYLTQHQDLSSYVSKTELSNYGYLTQHQDLSNYPTFNDISNMGYISTLPNLSNYITQEKLSSNSYLTYHQDLSSYVSKTELSNLGYLTQHQSLDNYATKSYVISYVNNYTPILDIEDLKDRVSLLEEITNRLINNEPGEPSQNSYLYIDNNLFSYTSYTYWNITYNTLPNIVKQFSNDNNVSSTIFYIDPIYIDNSSYTDQINCIVLTNSTYLFNVWAREMEQTNNGDPVATAFYSMEDNKFYYPKKNNSDYILYSYEFINNEKIYFSGLLVENSYITGILHIGNNNYDYNQNISQFIASNNWQNIISQNNNLSLYLSSYNIPSNILNITLLDVFMV